MRDQTLVEIRKLASDTGGQPPGARKFEQQTGIRQSAWRGVYWARWSDAVKEAGFEPNAKQSKLDENVFLEKLAEACRYFGKLPTAMEFRIYGRQNPEFPNHKTIYSHFQSTANMFQRLAQWSSTNLRYTDVAAMFADQTKDAEVSSRPVAEGFVYLIRSGAHYKIGRSDQLERRVREIRIALPDRAKLVHSIRTDDPPGIEAYWHKRFADRRANGEWFKLTNQDVAAFKRRRFQ